MFRVPKFLSALLLAYSATCYGQEVRATISGIVTDPAGAPIAGAVVTVTSLSAGTATVAHSNETGSYTTAFLAPGEYSLKAENKGFKKFEVEKIVLQTLDKARIDIHLEIGAMAETITVSASAATLQTETANRGATLANELIANLPTQGRNPFQIAWAAPGVVKSGSWRYLRSFDIGGTSGFSVNGGRSQENEVLVDGISNVRVNRQVIHVPTMDSVQEFKVLTNTYDAQYGRTGGGIVTIVTKSGGNQLHGTAYEFFQNDKLNANQTELNAAGTKKSPNHINAYGFEAAGPVYIPKVVDARNRLFWMIAYEGMKQRSADPAVATFPLAEWRTGDFSTLYNAQGAQVAIYDPLTTAADGTRTVFAGNKLPTSRISSVATNVFKLYPSPTSTGSNAAHINNYVFPSRWIGDLSQWIGRLDFNINSKNIVNFRYGQNPYSEYRSLTFVSSSSENNPSEPSTNAPLLRNGRNWAFGWTSMLSSSMTFDLRAGLSRWENAGGNSFGLNYDPTQLGFDSSLTGQFTRKNFPYFNLGTYQNSGASSSYNGGASDAYSLQPNLNWAYGRHMLKFGFEMRKYNDNSINPGLASGAYTFDKTWTQAVSNRSDAVSGNEVATFLLGYPSGAFVDRNIDPSFTNFYYAGFVQDDWKVTSRLTINMGLRWDYESPATERHNRMTPGLDFNAASPIASQVSGLSLKGRVLFANVDGQGRGSLNSDRNNFAPRIGAAYRLTDKWVLRGGYGLFYLGQNATGSNQGFSRTTNAVVTTDSLKPAVTLNNAFALQPSGQLLSPVGSSNGASSFLGESISPNWQDRPLAYSHQYSFDIQHELPGNLLLEVGYVGNMTRKLPIELAANFVPTAQLNQRTSAGVIDTAYYTAKVTNPMAGLIPNNASLNGATITRTTLWNAFPQFSGVTVKNLPIGRQRYDSAQFKVSKRFSNGLTLLASYTVSKTLEQVSVQNAQDFNLADPSATKLIKQPADNIDIPQKFNLTGVYSLPFGRGRTFAKNVSRPVDAIVGGWDFNFNVLKMSGWAVKYPNAAQATAGSAKLDDPTPAQWFNTGLWNNTSTGKRVSAQESYTLTTFPLRFSDVRLPGNNNWDLSIAKSFTLHERLRLQYKFEAVNAFNHPWLSNIASVDVTSSSFGRLSPTQGNLPRFLKMGLTLLW
jgi:hypothetical protein